MSAYTLGVTATGRRVHAVPAGHTRSLCGVPVMLSLSAFEPTSPDACPRCRQAVAR